MAAFLSRILTFAALAAIAFADGEDKAPLCDPGDGPDAVALRPRLLRRADSFTCPVFRSWGGVTDTCSGDAIVWNNRTTLNKHVTLYYLPHDKVIVNSGAAYLKTAIDLIAGSLDTGMPLYQQWGAGTNIYFGIVGDHDAYGSARPEQENEKLKHCEVVVRYPDPTAPQSEISLRTTKAAVHEFYHCVQYAQNLKGRNSGSSERRSWWMEGTARFFDGVIFPIPANINILGRGAFPEEYNPSVSLVEQSYEAALFWHYLVQTGIKPSEVNAWVATKLGRNSVKEDLVDIEGTPLFANNWLGFAQAFVDNKINYTASIPIPIVNRIAAPSPLQVSLSVGGKMNTTGSDVAGFTFNLRRVAFPASTVHSLEPPKGTPCSVRLVGDSAWRPVSSAFNFTTNSEAAQVEVVCACNKSVACSSRFLIERSR